MRLYMLSQRQKVQRAPSDSGVMADLNDTHSPAYNRLAERKEEEREKKKKKTKQLKRST